MIIPSNQQAQAYIDEAAEMNPGPWVNHCRQVASAARRIAERHPELEPEPAYSLGLLHDIGRRAGPSDMRHVLDGYRFLMDEGYPDAARICLTHSFPVPHPGAASGQWDVPDSDLAFVRQYLQGIEYTPYDHLIQLCDALCLPDGPVLMEKRLLDVVLRHGFNDFTLPKWRAFLTIQTEFEARLGTSIYQLLPGVIENTFLISISDQAN